MASSRIEKVYFLYGSQTGNSEQAALDLVQQVPTKLSPSRIQSLTKSNVSVTVEPVHMQLDDFLEMDHCQWTRLIVIVVSSYGVGQAPLGSWRFRELCDTWLEQQEGQNDDTTKTKGKVLKGMKYAMCGLGDSKYTTFFRNPTVIDQGLTSVGATRVGPLGKADASGSGNLLQSKVIEDWIANIWPHLAEALVQEPLLSYERLAEMQQDTIALCQNINPDYKGPSSMSHKPLLDGTTLAGVIVVFLAVIMWLILSKGGVLTVN